MRIAKVQAYRYDLPLKQPLPLRHETLNVRSGLLIRFESDSGLVAWGDAAPLPGFSRESIEEVTEQARDLAQGLPGVEISPEVAGRQQEHPPTAPPSPPSKGDQIGETESREESRECPAFRKGSRTESTLESRAGHGGPMSKLHEARTTGIPTSSRSAPHESPFEGGGAERRGMFGISFPGVFNAGGNEAPGFTRLWRGCLPLSLLGPLGLAPSMRFAVESALLGLGASARNVPPSRLLSEKASARVPLNALLAGNRDEVLEMAKQRFLQGYRTFKLKVGRRSVDEDIDTVRCAREHLGDKAALRLDANRAWDLDEAVGLARGVQDCGVEYIEEPLRDPSGLAVFAADAALPVALDETLMNCGPEDLGQHSFAKAIVLKPTLLGGLRLAMDYACEARRLGMTPVVSSAFESGVGLLDLAHLAAAIGGEGTAAGLDTYSWLAEDILAVPLPIEGGCLDLTRAVAMQETIRMGALQEVSCG